MKYQVIRTDEVLAQATSTLIYGRPDCTEVLFETDSLKEAILSAYNANQDRDGGRYSGARVAMEGDAHAVIMAHIPLAYRCLGQFTAFGEKCFDAADDSLSLSRLNKRMDAYYYGVEM